MTVDCHELNYAGTPIAAAVQDVTSLLEQINIHSGTWCAPTDLADAFLPHLPP